MRDIIINIFFELDEFWKTFQPQYQHYLLKTGRSRYRETQLTMSEIMTILVLFHMGGFRNF